MAIEIERKFLLASDAWRAEVTSSSRFCQGYMQSNEASSVRIRTAGEQAWLNIKGATLGATRLEFEYPIPVADAELMLTELCDKPFIDKVRHIVPMGQHRWEIDEFSGDNQGLVVAEIELSAEDEAFAKPAWLGAEVTGETRYYNVCLVQHPYKHWAK